MKSFKIKDRFLLIIICMLQSIIVQAQDIKIAGKVFGSERSGMLYTLPFANVFWENTTIGTVTDEIGRAHV